MTVINNYGFGGAADIVGGMGLLFSAVICVAALALIIYARSMVKRGVLV